MTVLLWVNLVALVVIGGAFSLSALLAFGMASADPTGGPLVRQGVLQLPACISWWVFFVLGVRQAHRAFGTTGWGAVGAGALGWGIFLGGAVATVAVFSGLRGWTPRWHGVGPRDDRRPRAAPLRRRGDRRAGLASPLVPSDLPSFTASRSLAETLLADHLPEHWRHTQARAREAVRLAALPEVDREPLIHAAVLLDVGRSPVAVRTGFPPLDAARFLRVRGYPPRLLGLVAHQLAADVEAERVGVDLSGFEREESATVDALWWCALVADLAAAPLAVDDGRVDTEGRRRDATRGAVARTRARLDAARLSVVVRDPT